MTAKYAPLFAISFLLLASGPASAETFASSKARVTISGQYCKKAAVEIAEDRIVINCKKAGYAMAISELRSVRWVVKSGWGTITAVDKDDKDFILSVKKKEFELLKAVLVSRVGIEEEK